jgi:hypothetical protein
MKLDNKHLAFFALARAGLWEQDVRLSIFGQIDFNEVYRLAEEQSVMGLVAAGIEHVKDVKVPQNVALTFVGGALQLEQRNLAMNDFIAGLVRKMREANLFTVLVKGQGVAQCYERPLWRSSGDVDLFVSSSSYYDTADFLTHLASHVEENRPDIKHLAMTVGPWEVELHGTLRSQLGKRIDDTIDLVQKEVFCGGEVRVWQNKNIDVFLPAADNDVVFIFTHILQHFFRGGIGLRQICDWCRLLWKYKDSINRELLKQRISDMGLVTEWLAFAYLTVNYLGMPKEAMPFYDPAKRWKRKADKVIAFILETGNFGHNRDSSYISNTPVIRRKIISLWHYFKDNIRHLFIFPNDSLRVMWLIIINRGKIALND